MVCWLLVKLGCLAACFICWVFSRSGHVVWCLHPVVCGAIFLCLPRAERNQRFLFVKNESIKFCCSGGFSNVPDVMEASVLFISTVFHVRSVSCRCLYLGFPAPCAARVTRVTCSKRSLLGVPLELE